MMNRYRSFGLGLALVAVTVVLAGCTPWDWATPQAAERDCTARAPQADLSGCDLSYEAFSADLDLTGANFSHANLSHATFEVDGEDGVALDGADFSYADLSSARFDTASLSNVNLFRADLSDSFIAYSYVSGNGQHADLSGASILYGSALSGNWRWATFTDAVILDAFLGASDFAGTDFANAQIAGTSFFNADFTFTNLSGVTLDDDNDLTGVKWMFTTCPDGSVKSSSCLAPAPAPEA